MRGFMKQKPAGNQLLIVVGITLASFFLIGLLGTVLLTSFSGMKMSDLTNMSKWDFSQPSTLFMVRGMMVVQFLSLCLLPSLVAAWLFSENSKKYLGLKSPSDNLYLVAGVVAILVAIPLVNWLGELNRQVQFPADIAKWMKEKEAEAALTIKGLLSQRTPKDLVLNIIFIAGLAAVGEELLLRGVAQRLFIKWFKNPWLGIIVAAFIFSAMHVQFYGFVPRFVLGILLGLLYWYSSSLWTAILAHFVYDAALIILVYYNPEMLNENATVQTSNLVAAGAISAALVVTLVVWMKKKSVNSYAATYKDDAVPVKNHPF
jgi:uncharacterized protein